MLLPAAKFWKKKHSELVWFESPNWTEHILVTEGPDVAFSISNSPALLSATGSKLPVIVAAQFFVNPQLAIYYCDSSAAKTWSDCAPADIANITIDSKEGSYFNLRIVDLNGDGADEILATNNRADGLGAVFAHEPPSSVGGAWNKRVLSRGWKPKHSWLPRKAKLRLSLLF